MMRTVCYAALAGILTAFLSTPPPSWAGESMMTVELPDAKSGRPYVLNISTGSIESLPPDLKSENELLAAFRTTGDIVYANDIMVASGKCAVLDRAGVVALIGTPPSRVTKQIDVVHGPKAGDYLLIQRIDGGHAVVRLNTVRSMESTSLSWVLNPGTDTPFRKEDITALLDSDARAPGKPAVGVATIKSMTGSGPTGFSFSEARARIPPLPPGGILSEAEYRAYGKLLTDSADLTYEFKENGARFAHVLSRKSAVLGRGSLSDFADQDLSKRISGKNGQLMDKELTPGTIIALQDRGGKYALIRIEKANANGLKFQWAYLEGGKSIFPRIDPLPDAVPTVTEARDLKSEAQTRLMQLVYQSAQMSEEEVKAEFQGALADGADVNKPTATGYGPLMEAASLGSLRLVTLMIEAGADVNASAALHAAAYAGREDICELLLAKGADRSQRNRQGKTAFEEANSSRRSSAEVLKLCQPEGEAGRTLHAAALLGKADLARELIAQRADVNAYDSSGRTPLQLAAEAGHVELCEILLAAGADIEKGTQFKKIGPMILAVRAGQKDTVSALLDNASVNQIGEALYETFLSKRPEITEAIVERAKDLTGLYRGAQPEFNSLLRAGQRETYLLLAGKGVVLPLWAAAAAGDSNAIKKAIDEGQAVDEPGTDFAAETPLHAAVRASQHDSARLLLHAGANPNAKSPSRKGWTPLRDALDQRNEQLAALLLQNKADVNLVDDQGCTPLYWAVQQGYVVGVKLLLEAGASTRNIPALRSNDGTATLLVDKTRNQDIIRLLRCHDFE